MHISIVYTESQIKRRRRLSTPCIFDEISQRVIARNALRVTTNPCPRKSWEYCMRTTLDVVALLDVCQVLRLLHLKVLISMLWLGSTASIYRNSRKSNVLVRYLCRKITTLDWTITAVSRNLITCNAFAHSKQAELKISNATVYQNLFPISSTDLPTYPTQKRGFKHIILDTLSPAQKSRMVLHPLRIHRITFITAQILITREGIGTYTMITIVILICTMAFDVHKNILVVFNQKV